MGRAKRRLERRIEVLKWGVRERCAIQRVVAQEYSSPEMLSSMELNSLDEDMRREVSHAVLALQQSNANDFFAAGDVSPASSRAAQERVAYHLPAQIRSVVQAELRVLRAEGAVQHDEKSSVGDLATASQKRRGPVANMSRHEEIGKTVKPHLNAGTTQENLALAETQSGSWRENVAGDTRSPQPQPDTKTERHAMVSAFLSRVNAFLSRVKPQERLKVLRKHIWLAAGHQKPRQFQYWQAADAKATDQDDQNFRRILAMTEANFVTILQSKKITLSSF